MNEGKLSYEIAMDYNASGGNEAKVHIEKIKAGYMAFNQVLRGDFVGAIQSANNAIKGFSSSLSSTLGLLAKFAGPLMAGFAAGKFLDNTFGISDKIAAAIVPAVKFNTEITDSMAKLREINKIKLDAVTKEFAGMGEAMKKASAHAMELINLTNQTNVAKAPTESAQYKASQSGKMDVLKQLDKNRGETSDKLKSAEREYIQRINKAGFYNERRELAAKNGTTPELAKAYRLQEEDYRKATKDLESTILSMKDSLEVLDKQIEQVGSDITRSSREMVEQADAKAAEEDKKWSDQMTQIESEGKSGQKESFDQDPRPVWQKVKDKYTQPYERLTDEQKENQMARRKYAYSQMTPEQKLAQTDREIKETKTAASSKKISPAEQSALIKDYYERLAPERSKLVTEIDGNKTKDASTRAEKIKDAQGNIAKARERQVGGSDLAGYFQRTSDLRHGRAPQDDAAKQTAENTRIIAENTAVLAGLGVVKP